MKNNGAQSADDMPTDYSRAATAMVQRLAEVSEPLALAMAGLRAFMESFEKTVENIKFALPEGAIETLRKAAEAARPLAVIQTLGEAQYVCWGYLDSDFIDLIEASENTNKALLEYHESSKFVCYKATIKECEELLTDRHAKRLFGQAIYSYDNKQYDIATIGLVAVIDWLLTFVSGDVGTKITKRAEAILSKIEGDDEISSAEYSFVALIWTYRDTMESLDAFSHFSGKEPRGLNRHWIAHGRSQRRKTRLDCIKLTNFIYATMLINTLNETQGNGL